jgi:hypothetical protein
MTVVDAHTGFQFDVPSGVGKPTTWLSDPPTFASLEGGTISVLEVVPGLFSARAKLRDNRTGRTWDQELAVRWTHPGFFLKHVAFIPS